ncbi:hypothetical protein [Shewanella surugensis]|uniref:YheU family protein n=1 Tax=Shewanella surugensis TaxID=212020 RepID=A0ABT0LIW1_9GAMM|nr:hypothetical protein [Shewanella surugensis]MCL1127634.1 hypothetical protein [Shewanella surugensis]
MTTDINQSTSIDSIAAYLKLKNQCDEKKAFIEAKQMMHELLQMRQQGLITGWYFNEQGKLELLPAEKTQHSRVK